MRYVIYHENPNTHREVYIRVTEQGYPAETPVLEQAKRFATPREAYEFAELLDLDWWHVGER